MKRTFLAVSIGMLLATVIGMGCMDRAPAPVCPVPTELSQSESLVTNFQGLDMLLVVDNSGSMQEEQEIFATAIYRLVNTLTNNPDPTWEWPDVTNVRIGVITSDMGLQYGDDGLEPEGVSVDGCGGPGDDGRFVPNKIETNLTLYEGAIDCAVDSDAGPDKADQCPFFGDTDSSWNCEDPDGDGSFHCYVNDENPADTDVSNVIDCDAVITANSPWASTPSDPNDPSSEPNYALPLEVACLTNLGTEGCGIEQQLQAAKKSLDYYVSQELFIRDEALLAVLIVSDEEDCSIFNSQLFNQPEFANTALGKINIACDLDDGKYLHPAIKYADWFAAAKNDVSAAVVFAAIVGVPIDDACEGFGNEIESCADHPDMEYRIIDDPTGSQKVARPACVRLDSSDEIVTEARPGRRYVQLARQMKDKGYIYSICNEDWSQATAKIAELIASNLSASCYPKPLDWDPDNNVAKCDVVIVKTVDQSAESIGAGDWDEICGFELKLPEGVEPITEETISGAETAGTVKTQVFCPLPKLEHQLICSDKADKALDDEFGWFYCEDPNENFQEACKDALDNDNDGLYDCDDPNCQSCPACGGKECEGGNSCQYAVRLTDFTENSPEVKNHSMAVQCLQRFQFTDENCQENTGDVCEDHKDNDGNGVLDCDGTHEDGADPDWHFADPACCPIPDAKDVGWTETKNADGKVVKRECILKDKNGNLFFENTCGDYSEEEPPPACRTRAAELGCQL